MQETTNSTTNVVHLFNQKKGGITPQDSLGFASDYLTCAIAVATRLAAYLPAESQDKSRKMLSLLKEAQELIKGAIAMMPSPSTR
ncbi:hypothetical protein M2401_003058 [Pseudomonas sp. JUb42]|jgi:hypothetical protein|uniref:hypothetical protein n=1 Tax=Pseudomonas sp. JUb42 TaxID=2940611 RepID=UPI00216A3701|nr:hypothetical protein [Pseudomonas sp. JUb42]MCS3469320.1 hypothetical protein [Pseudomonas sp. JUb42]